VIYEERIYSFTPETLADHLDKYERLGFPHHTRCLGKLLAYFTTDIGELNECTHIWVYQDLADRAAKRAGLWADPDWLAYVKIAPKPVRMRNRILVPTKFSPLQ
jgi:hypothetical protein